MIKHVSLDVWNTLLKPNPKFAHARTQYIASVTNTSEQEVARAFATVKTRVDFMAEMEGVGIPTTSAYSRLLDQLRAPQDHAAAIRTYVDALFVEHPPLVEDAVRQCLEFLYDRGITVSVASNTVFVSGTVMLPHLTNVLGNRFICSDFSDLLLVAKPSPRFFQNVAIGVDAAHGGDGSGSEVAPREIMHVGDSELCDIVGARNAGFSSLLISGPEEIFDKVRSCNLSHCVA